ncbi:MAG TPA: MFS transporter [Caldilineaceae bacterium]|nr:MFS transporter [Caldilineaceae bacterium]
MKESFWHNPLLMPVYVPTLIIAFGRGMLVPILPLYAASFDASYGLVGLVIASQGIGMITGDIPAGILLSRMGQRRSMLVGVGMLAVMALAMSWAQSLTELILYGLFAGIGTALWNVSRHAYLANAAPTDRRGRAIAIFGGVNRAGSFIGPALGGLIGGWFGLRWAFVVYALITAIAFVLPLLYAEENFKSTSRGGVGSHSMHFLRLLREHAWTFSTAGTGQLLAQMIRAGRTIVIPLFAQDVLGLGVEAIGLIVSIGSGIDMLMFYPAGIVMDRIGRKWAYVPCFALQAVGMALIPFTWNFATLVAATSLIGFGNGLGSGTMMTLGADLAPPDSMGEFLGLWRLIGDGGQSGGPIVVGAVAQVVGLIPAIFVIAVIGALGSTIFGVFVPETLGAKRIRVQPQG